jgi:hypothetical protein
MTCRRPATAVVFFTALVAVLPSCTPLESAHDRFEVAAAQGGDNHGGESGFAGTTDAGAGGDAGSPAMGACPNVADRPIEDIGVIGQESAIPAGTTFRCDKTYRLLGPTLVPAGTTLTIEASVKVLAGPGSMLLVQRGGALDARGTPEEPVVFTSANAEGERRPGDWRGIVLIGAGRTHTTSVPVYNTLADYRAHYGGGPLAEGAASCGHLHYVRVEFAGGNLDEAASPGASLTLAGCGSGTVVDHVQVHRGTDGIGLFGGSAPLSHVVVSHNQRGDCIEWTAGYTGTMSFVVAQSLGAAAGMLGSNSEADPTLEPVSSPRIYNATVIGSPPLVGGSHFGFLLQFGSLATFKNSIVAGFADAAFDLRLADVPAVLGPGMPLDISHVLMDETETPYSTRAQALESMLSMRRKDPGLGAATRSDAPSFRPTSDTVRVEVAPAPPPFDATAAYRGAISPDGEDWTAGWTAYPPN